MQGSWCCIIIIFKACVWYDLLGETTQSNGIVFWLTHNLWPDMQAYFWTVDGAFFIDWLDFVMRYSRAGEFRKFQVLSGAFLQRFMELHAKHRHFILVVIELLKMSHKHPLLLGYPSSTHQGEEACLGLIDGLQENVQRLLVSQKQGAIAQEKLKDLMVSKGSWLIDTWNHIAQTKIWSACITAQVAAGFALWCKPIRTVCRGYDCVSHNKRRVSNFFSFLVHETTGSFWYKGYDSQAAARRPSQAGLIVWSTSCILGLIVESILQRDAENVWVTSLYEWSFIGNQTCWVGLLPGNQGVRQGSSNTKQNTMSGCRRGDKREFHRREHVKELKVLMSLFVTLWLFSSFLYQCSSFFLQVLHDVNMDYWNEGCFALLQMLLCTHRFKLRLQ